MQYILYMLVFSVKSKGSTTFLSSSHHLSSFFLIIWILNQGWNLFGKKRIDVFISPRFKCAIVDIFTMLMLRSFGLCLIKCVTYHSGWRPRGIVTHFIRQSPKDRSITTLRKFYYIEKEWVFYMALLHKKYQQWCIDEYVIVDVSVCSKASPNTCLLTFFFVKFFKEGQIKLL